VMPSQFCFLENTNLSYKVFSYEISLLFKHERRPGKRNYPGRSAAAG